MINPEKTRIKSGDSPTLETLASQFLEEHRRLLNPSIESYQCHYPQLTQQIEELFPVLLAMEQWKEVREIQEVRKKSKTPFENVFLGQVKLLREIGRGELSTVCLARQEHLEREVAVKLMPCSEINSSRLRERFERQARTIARLQHKNIVPVYHYGETRNYCYYVMQLVRGASLDWVIRRMTDFEENIHPEEFLYATNPNLNSKNHLRKSEQGALHKELGRESWKTFACIMVHVLNAISYAHEQGTLHNNLKPSNILVDKEGHIWITDFGLAQYQRLEAVKSIEQNIKLFQYMAPERFQNYSSEKSDLYSAGAILYELCTLLPAIEEGPSSEVISRILNGDIPPARIINSSVPVELEEIIMKAMSCDPDERFHSAEEMKTSLLNFINKAH